MKRRVKPIRIRIVKRRAPDVGGIVIGQVHHIRIGRLDIDDRASGVIRSGHSLLTGRGQFSGLLRPEPHSLDRIHHVRLLRQKGVSKIRRPGDVLVQALDQVRKDHQRLDAGVPVLLLGRLREQRARQPADCAGATARPEPVRAGRSRPLISGSTAGRDRVRSARPDRRVDPATEPAQAAAAAGGPCGWPHSISLPGASNNKAQKMAIIGLNAGFFFI